MKQPKAIFPNVRFDRIKFKQELAEMQQNETKELAMCKAA